MSLHPAEQFLAQLARNDGSALRRAPLPELRGRLLTPRGKMTTWGAE